MNYIVKLITENDIIALYYLSRIIGCNIITDKIDEIITSLRELRYEDDNRGWILLQQHPRYRSISKLIRAQAMLRDEVRSNLLNGIRDDVLLPITCSYEESLFYRGPLMRRPLHIRSVIITSESTVVNTWVVGRSNSLHDALYIGFNYNDEYNIGTHLDINNQGIIVLYHAGSIIEHQPLTTTESLDETYV